MKKKSLLFCLLTLLMFNFSNVFASSKLSLKEGYTWQEIYESAMDEDSVIITNEDIAKSLKVYLKNRNDEDAFAVLSAGYLRGSTHVKSVIKKTVGAKDRVITFSEQILKNVGK